jgi:plastocyanin
MLKRLLVLASILALAVVLATSAFGRSSAKTLKGTVGPGFTITLTYQGKKVKTLKAGAYTVTVADKSNIHNFEMEQESGGKWEKEVTDVSQTGTKTVKVTLKKGKYKYYCKPHEPQMFGTFTVK